MKINKETRKLGRTLSHKFGIKGYDRKPMCQLNRIALKKLKGGKK